MNWDVRQLLAAAQLAADRAAAFLLREEGRRGPDQWSEKGRADFVTEVDRESERMISETLLAAAPGSTVVGEELTPSGATSGLAWVVDPLDGTTNYLHRFPFYAVSIGAVVDGQPVAGVVHHVSLNIRYHAVAGGGAFQNGTPIRVSGVTKPQQALIGTGFPFKFMDQLPIYAAQFAAVIAGSGGLRRPGSAALDFCEVAAGRFDGFWELRLAPWDVAAGTLIVREAGGFVTDCDGGAEFLKSGDICCGNEFIHREMLTLLRGASGARPG